jgi:hypothetical protein
LGKNLVAVLQKCFYVYTKGGSRPLQYKPLECRWEKRGIYATKCGGGTSHALWFTA